MPKGTTRRRPQTLARLLDAAMEVFAEQGFRGARIEDICDRAGYTRGAFYSNFTTKDELFFALFDAHAANRLARVAEQIARIDRRDLTVQHIAAVLADRALDADARNWYLVTTEFTLHAIRDPEAARKLAEHDARLRAQIVNLLQRLIEQAGHRPARDLDRIARMVVVVLEGAPAQSLVEPDALPPGSLEQTMLTVLLRALSTVD